MSTIDEHKKSRLGRPPVDSELARARLDRPILDALDSYAASDKVTRPQAIRAILADWLRTHGFLSVDAPKPTGPATDAVEAMDKAIKKHHGSRKP